MKANTILETIGKTPHVRIQRLFGDAEVAEAMRLAFRHLKLVIEPGGEAVFAYPPTSHALGLTVRELDPAIASVTPAARYRRASG